MKAWFERIIIWKERRWRRQISLWEEHPSSLLILVWGERCVDDDTHSCLFSFVMTHEFQIPWRIVLQPMCSQNVSFQWMATFLCDRHENEYNSLMENTDKENRKLTGKLNKKNLSSEEERGDSTWKRDENHGSQAINYTIKVISSKKE